MASCMDSAVRSAPPKIACKDRLARSSWVSSRGSSGWSMTNTMPHAVPWVEGAPDVDPINVAIAKVLLRGAG